MSAANEPPYTGTMPEVHARVRRRSPIFVVIAALFLLVTFAGFHRTFYLRPLFPNDSLAPLFWMHGTVLTAWLLLFLVQTVMVQRGRVALHRRLGLAAAAVAAAVIATGIAVAIVNARANIVIAGPRILRVVPFQLADIALFTTFTGLALLMRRAKEMHKRLMVLGTASLLAAPFARFHRLFPAMIPFHGPTLFNGGVDLLVVTIALADFVRTRRLHPAYLWGGLGVIVAHRATGVVANSAAWLRLGHWLIA